MFVITVTNEASLPFASTAIKTGRQTETGTTNTYLSTSLRKVSGLQKNNNPEILKKKKKEGGLKLQNNNLKTLNRKNDYIASI